MSKRVFLTQKQADCIMSKRENHPWDRSGSANRALRSVITAITGLANWVDEYSEYKFKDTTMDYQESLDTEIKQFGVNLANIQKQNPKTLKNGWYSNASTVRLFVATFNNEAEARLFKILSA